MITTTPNNLDVDEGMYCHQMISNSVPFDESWYDWNITRVKKFISDNSRNDFTYIEFSYKELGKDEKWLQEQIRALNGDMLKVKREIFLQWTFANNTSPFTEEQLIEIEKWVLEPIGKFYINGIYKFDILQDMHNLSNKSWIISVDVASGLGLDATCITITDPSSMKPFAEFSNNTIGTANLTALLISLVQTMFPRAVVVIERNYTGIAVIDLLLKTSIAKNLYYEYRIKKGEKKIDDPKKNSKKIKSEVRVYGIDTTKSSRKIMIDEILNGLINDTPEILVSGRIFKDIRTLERNNKGKIEHRSGCHDDSLFSYLVGLYMLLYGNNTNKFIKVTSDNNSGNGGTPNDTVVNNIRNMQDTISSNSRNFDLTISERLIESFLNTDTSTINNKEDKCPSKKILKSMNWIRNMNS